MRDYRYVGAGEHYHYSYDDVGDMMMPVSRCMRFERRYDFSAFNMADYSSCENCRHFSADNRCNIEGK